MESLYNSLYKYQKASLNEILNTQISKLDLQIELENLKTSIDNAYLNLEQISYEKIENINEKLSLKPISKEFIESDLLTHPKVKVLEENSLKYKQIAKLEEANKFSEVTLSVEYMQNKEQDFANISVAIPLPIYKTENLNKVKANLNSNETNDRLQSLLHNLRLQNKIYLNSLNQSAKNYELIQKEIIPLKVKIQKNLENYNSFDLIKPQDNITNLNELLNYEIKALEEALKYYEAYSQLIYFSNKGIK